MKISVLREGERAPPASVRKWDWGWPVHRSWMFRSEIHVGTQPGNAGMMA
jgi:hypothetical protein